ncbi:prephenate dehydrogenase/arogenate dehydrogenase family protein [Xenorhabdus bovienii]|uniref:Prephenate dehydrogenase/arogenate dehydrogenase family protein n=1 Tax=Xenorhabdus bovienii TaxID=40576 RepID=A0AAJ1N353_XENBV|nr:prephenate dehydrogenase dimerization domain-containing protein [Xenorhabdus bovienii]MDE1480177.1 prephenate dehydrogenase/arogenate dehydrogenase family protein [Xenorhabdus bovienii]MDE1492561.1 prephenate dehydrogenase/arogenate dehydrogenase family protein [Xenorhabdus bovienii]MDE1497170.1 prephenate dehydrogenase/arogenate dehydrogenase family protein [Xenorhabdus bovienii]MDE9474853.1 prephenate dehydrogenase/arogenate dehydrogenase family protein [Xenorhabdus bovienii]MDE9511888.1 
MNNLNVMILGCNGAIGSFLGRIFSTSGYAVHGIDKQGSGNYASYSEMDLLNPISNIDKLLNEVGMIIFSLPENVAIKTLSWILPTISNDILIVSTCSVQEPFYSSLKSISPKQPFVGINPMFSPSLQENNRPVILILEDMHRKHQLIESVLKKSKMNITKMLPKEHDEIMALCQALPHAVILIFGLVLKSNLIDISVLYNVMPPPMRTMLALLARILFNSKEIYWDIQYENPMAVEIRGNILNEISLLNSIIQSGDSVKFNNSLDEIKLRLDKCLYSSHTDCQYIFQCLSNDNQ